jgi:tetratricopeptide (TPR) repeat protein
LSDFSSGPGQRLSLVHQGWQHLRLQRPLAAWASWQQALRIAPDDPAARQALRALETAAELPPSARASYKFQTPADEPRRRRWDARLASGHSLDDLEAAASAFESLCRDDPGDADARLNRALCLAWLGRNAEAVEELGRVVLLLAPSNPGRAADAATLAEVLRLGAGAEPFADDLRHTWKVDFREGEELPADLAARWPNLRPVAMPADPLTGGQALDDGQVFEWLDRPISTGVSPAPSAVPRVLATVILTPRVLRLSTPDPSGFSALDEPAMQEVARLLARGRREATPLPLAWADAALGTFRLPPGLDEASKHDLARGVVEHYFENVWVHQPREALGGRSPLEAARESARGDAVARARLEGVVRFREQLGSRPTHAGLYRGYPFDRLRRRLGLIGEDDSGAVAPDDVTCMSEPEVDALDPAALDDQRLADAFASASALAGNARTARFAAELIRRYPATLGRLDLSAVVAPVVREALREGDPRRALSALERARTLTGDKVLRRTLTVWTAEVLARTGRPDDALVAYQSLLDAPDSGPGPALDGAETLIDNGYPEHALPLLLEARSRALASGDRETLEKVGELLGG